MKAFILILISTSWSFAASIPVRGYVLIKDSGYRSSEDVRVIPGKWIRRGNVFNSKQVFYLYAPEEFNQTISPKRPRAWWQ